MMRDIIMKEANQTDQVLIVGCGSSRMPEEMYEEGYQNVMSIDFCYSAIKLQTELTQESYLPHL